ncbi:MAG TPA: hypothetical protein VL096_13400 [Pirellulaceae bacterium]|nr:hypothetical protein [Pirellulaceae bacterium]
MRELLFSFPLLVCLAVAMLHEPPVIQPWTAPEATWAQQVAAVQAGRQDTIVVERQIVTDRNLADVANLERLIVLELGQSKLTARGIQQLQKLPNFRRLTLRGRPVDDVMLAEICAIPTVRRLNLPHTIVTDAGLAALRSRPQLVQLRFGSAHVTDAGLDAIVTLPKLRALHLVEVPITDLGLAKLSNMPQLESLYIDGASATDAGYEQLLKRLPELHLHIDQRHHDRDVRKGTHEH